MCLRLLAHLERDRGRVWVGDSDDLRKFLDVEGPCTMSGIGQSFTWRMEPRTPEAELARADYDRHVGPTGCGGLIGGAWLTSVEEGEGETRG